MNLWVLLVEHPRGCVIFASKAFFLGYFGVSVFLLFSKNRSIVSQGKVLHGAKGVPGSIYKILSKSNLTNQVSKSYFTHFYAVGSVVCLCVWGALAVNREFIKGSRVYAAQVMISVQIFARLLECIFIMKTTKYSKMLLLHYLIGIVYYMIVPLTPWIENSGLNGGHVDFLCVFGIILFSISFVLQRKVHYDLSRLRSNPNSILKDDLKDKMDCLEDSTLQDIILPDKGKIYPVPKTWIFALVCCPHYLFEVGMYVGIMIACANRASTPPSHTPSPTLACLPALNVLSVLFGLSVSARNQLSWFKWKYPNEISNRWKSIIPYIY